MGKIFDRFVYSASAIGFAAGIGGMVYTTKLINHHEANAPEIVNVSRELNRDIRYGEITFETVERKENLEKRVAELMRDPAVGEIQNNHKHETDKYLGFLFGEFGLVLSSVAVGVRHKSRRAEEEARSYAREVINSNPLL